MKPRFEQSGSWIGMSGMAVAFFLYAYSAIALPSWLHTFWLPLLWLTFLLLGARWFMTHPYRVLTLPVLAIGAWFAAMLLPG